MFALSADPLITLFTQSWEHEFEIGGPDHVADISFVVQQPGYGEWWQIYHSAYPEAFSALIEERMRPRSPAAQ